jgi:2-polyprenyl-3-methyl-5-hydroxy-6-metoxy-1,4-benzoquinol methylase
MNKESKTAIIKTHRELFTRGEILKALYFVENCIPLWLQDDETINVIKAETTQRVAEIKSWNESGRPYPGVHATVDFSSFPKFIAARDAILAHIETGSLLDVGCYGGDFIRGMRQLGFACYGVDVHKELMEKLNKESDGEPCYIFASLERLPLADKSLDVVTAFDVLEHVVDFDKALSEIERVCKSGGLIIINLPRMTYAYEDEALEHLRMFSDSDIQRIWSNRRSFKFTLCKDEFGRPTSFITYING